MPQLTLPSTFTNTATSPPKQLPRPTRIMGIVTNLWHKPSVEPSSTSQHVYIIEVLNAAGTCFLIRLRYDKRDYRPVTGTRLTLTLAPHALKPLFEIPNIPDAIVTSTSARVGANIFPERDNKPLSQYGLHILTPINTVVDDEVFEEIMKREEKHGQKKQMTFSLFAEWIRICPKDVFVGYISAIPAKMGLVTLWKKQELFCEPCHCGNVLVSNDGLAICTACKGSRYVRIQPNPHILASLSDETAGIGHDACHNLLVMPQAWKKLLGHSPLELTDKLCTMKANEVETMLKDWEQRLQYLRLTFVLGWTGRLGHGRMVVIDIVD